MLEQIDLPMNETQDASERHLGAPNAPAAASYCRGRVVICQVILLDRVDDPTGSEPVYRHPTCSTEQPVHRSRIQTVVVCG